MNHADDMHHAGGPPDHRGEPVEDDHETRRGGGRVGPQPNRPVPLPFAQPGSKRRMMRHAVPLIPVHTNYVSVFGGTGAEIIGKPRSPIETFNDRCEAVFNLFRVLQDRGALEDLLWRVWYTPHSRLEYEHAVRLLGGAGGSVVDRAAAFLVVGNQARVAHAPTVAKESEWGYCRGSAWRSRWPALPRIVESVAERFREVQLECLDWADILLKYDHRRSFFMIDPPYPYRVRNSAQDLYEHEMDDRAHERLLDAVQDLRGYVMLWSYDSPLYQDRLEGWLKYRFRTRCSISRADRRPPRTEVAWLNYDPAVEERAFPNT